MIESKTPINNIEKIEKMGDPVKIISGRHRSKDFKPTSTPNEDRVIDSLDFKFKFDNVKDRVKSIIKGDKYARENYLWLQILYYSKMGMLKLLVPLEDFQYANSPETITRAFRKLMEETKRGMHPDLKFLLEEHVNDIRKEREENMRNMFIQDKESEKSKLLK